MKGILKETQNIWKVASSEEDQAPTTSEHNFQANSRTAD